MTSQYSRPRQRARTLGAGILSGAALSQEGVMQQLQSNIQFRVQSLRSMVTGQGEQGAMNPLERRQEIRQRRQSLLGSNGNGGNEGGTGGTGGDGAQSRGSGSIGRTGTNRTEPEGTNVQDSTPSMSEVDKGTKARATDRGFGN